MYAVFFHTLIDYRILVIIIMIIMIIIIMCVDSQ
jgi:preprotein translocase subunit SecE